MGVVEHAQVVWLGRIRCSNLARLDGEFGLSQSSPLYKNLHYVASALSSFGRVFAPGHGIGVH